LLGGDCGHVRADITQECLRNTWALSPITWLGVTYLKSPEKLSKLMARRPRRMPIKTKPSEYARLHVACLYPSYLLHMV